MQKQARIHERSSQEKLNRNNPMGTSKIELNTELERNSAKYRPSQLLQGFSLPWLLWLIASKSHPQHNEDGIHNNGHHKNNRERHTALVLVLLKSDDTGYSKVWVRQVMNFLSDSLPGVLGDIRLSSDAPNEATVAPTPFPSFWGWLMLHGKAFLPFKTGQPARSQAGFCLPLQHSQAQSLSPLSPPSPSALRGELSFPATDKGCRIY